MPEKNHNRQKMLKKYLLDRKMKMWNDLRDEFFRKLGKEYNSQFDNPHDIEELALIDMIEDMGIAVADLKRQELEQMDAALRKIDDGTYGTCEECGEGIEEERLKVIPFAEFCVKCKSGKETGKRPTL
ncbi:MAG: TraR/DksA C4-type zinc finger protein [Deltaproteobacteria bacterium]|nr:TraR/DksA C4-type zinc finger protein [Deltaproteobacteria bacterium]